MSERPVAFDLHQTLVPNGWQTVPEGNLQAVRDLVRLGARPWICSFIGADSYGLRQKAESVRQALQKDLFGHSRSNPPEPVAGALHLLITPHRDYEHTGRIAGWGGKAVECLLNGCDILFEDDPGQVNHCLRCGVLTYRVLAGHRSRIRTEFQAPWQASETEAHTLSRCVELFLEDLAAGRVSAKFHFLAGARTLLVDLRSVPITRRLTPTQQQRIDNWQTLPAPPPPAP